MNKSSSPPEAAAPLSAILLMLGAGFLFTCLDTTAKYLVQSGLDVQFVVWVRYAVASGAGADPVRRVGEYPRLFRTRSLPMQVLRAAFLLGSTFFNFLALQTLQLAESVSIFFFAPMVITALAGPLLGEWDRLAPLGGRRRRLPGRAAHHAARSRHVQVSATCSPCARCCPTPSNAIMTRKLGGNRKRAEPDLLFRPGTGPAACTRGAALWRNAGQLADPVPSSVAGRLWRARPLADHQGLQAGDGHGSGALSLSADGVA